MIGKLTGRLIEKRPPLIVIDCQGVGYELEAPMTTIYDLPVLGSQVTVFTHLAIRDDAHLLYGFLTDTERSLFKALLKVNGVGTKMALVILSGMDVSEFADCVRSEDWARLVSLPGVGKKTAERLVLDMRDKVDTISAGSTYQEPNSDSSLIDDAVAGLVSLGYKQSEAVRYIEKLEEKYVSSEEIIRQVLKNVLTR
ncbi:MAG: Holliday junction branch migration protein RuvA [Pseudomonadota bacterium]|nr:Holliday junction branch migration protein RuvA [Pseudomonadota bacterium]